MQNPSRLFEIWRERLVAWIPHLAKLSAERTLRRARLVFSRCRYLGGALQLARCWRLVLFVWKVLKAERQRVYTLHSPQSQHHGGTAGD